MMGRHLSTAMNVENHFANQSRNIRTKDLSRWNYAAYFKFLKMNQGCIHPWFIHKMNQACIHPWFILCK